MRVWGLEEGEQPAGQYSCRESWNSHGKGKSGAEHPKVGNGKMKGESHCRFLRKKMTWGVVVKASVCSLPWGQARICY